MLRKVVLTGALLLAAVALWLLVQHLWAPAIQLLLVAAVVFLGTVFEAWRYRKGPAPPGARWQQTGEKFVDPVSGEQIEVEYEPVSGERRYLRR